MVSNLVSGFTVFQDSCCRNRSLKHDLSLAAFSIVQPVQLSQNSIRRIERIDFNKNKNNMIYHVIISSFMNVYMVA